MRQGSIAQDHRAAWIALATALVTAIAVAQARAGLDTQRELATRLAAANCALDREAISVGELQRELLPD